MTSTDAEERRLRAGVDRAQRRLEHLIGKDFLMAGVFCLDCGKPWEEWDDKVNDICGCPASHAIPTSDGEP